MNSIDSNLRYIIYARKSSEGEDRQMASIEDQINEMQKLASTLNLNVVETITESQSAKKPGRKEFNRMLDRIYEGKADAILCWKLNRLSRNSVDGGKIIWMLTNDNVIKHIQAYGKEYKPTDNVLMMYVEFGMANQYVNDLSVDVKRGMRNKAERGWYAASTLPRGYKHLPKTERTNGIEIVPNDPDFKKIKLLWDKMITGNYSLPQIREEGTNVGLQSKHGTPLALSVYHRIFTNEFYSGYFYWNDAGGNKKRHKGKHKAMVSPIDFERVQRHIQRRNTKSTTAKKYDFDYRGVMYCGECGCGITAEHKLQVICTHCKHKFSAKNKDTCPKCKNTISQMENPTWVEKIYYHCTKRRGYCSQKSIEQVKLKEQIKEKIDSVAIPGFFYDLFLKGTEKREDNQAKNKEQELAILTKQIQSLTETRTKARRLFTRGKITEQEWEEDNQQYTNEIKSLEKRILELTEVVENRNQIIEDYIAFAKRIPDIFESDNLDEKRYMLQYLGSNLILKDKELNITLRKPLVELKKNYESYKTKLPRFEPGITLEKYMEKEAVSTLLPTLCARWDGVRTLIIEEVSRESVADIINKTL